ncbi:putative nuclease of restriction endonuclease-like (RecB) superfamily [Dyadobacter sp. BE34]|uniref:Nuclease of restriction endonuclease-like (RecB) superfamily n=1 Tax=Dyadobacter fermentans TaxID=94254 RepID=A0ABU1QR18_9BACT|nr:MULTISPECIES: PDDEXK nuclease domain-containing protein [Dyadobacter]MDR6803462.1 putative nuclease of restriction endonuclease-like (RecB) superfamily [Dyadobacter fermentans]MDR7041203.1 putative nuclease of restriction endonuclease-like (RecB) superfamily [Dyadobacter sp. BE242]MDR7195606.1 putative nuclease of restriction endonuclease-like (RecB) superfamily [Dyadobacter sp. BE34]MDR7213849.1 putative nuclease of restriction endonuclease-like (RecB) superfamily [Dyadobacter sp. BE31]MDR
MTNFNSLVSTIQETNFTLQQSASKAINRYLTIRNWLIGFHIVEFEQNGEDRAKYGQRLVDDLADALNIAGLSGRNLKLFRQFYLTYPQIVQTLSAQLGSLGMAEWNLLPVRIKAINGDVESRSFNFIDPEMLLSRLSFSHLTLLLPLREPEKRAFYERQCIKTNWSVAELKRQINTLYYERSGISLDPEALARSVEEHAERPCVTDIIKSPFTFEFLGLKAKNVVYENDLEQALVDNLEAFLIELGHGFCFEAKQKRIIIGDEYFFVDLVFYHRILKCHVLIELKTNEVRHEHIGQLKTYINYYKKEIMARDDNPPVGLLLVTDQNRALVEYAVADSDMQLFVSKYVVNLPSKEQLQDFIQHELAQMQC